MRRRGQRAEDQLRAVKRGKDNQRPIKEDDQEDCAQDAADQEAEPRAGILDSRAAEQGRAEHHGKIAATGKAGEGDGHLLEKDGEESPQETKDKGNDQRE